MFDGSEIRFKKKTYKLKNLWFLAEFLRMQETDGDVFSLNELAQRCNCSPQVLAWSMNNDNINLLKIDKLLDSYGYKITYELVNTQVQDEGKEILENEGAIVKQAGLIKATIGVERPETRLAFLLSAMIKYSAPLYLIADKIKMSRQALSAMIKRDDCFIATLLLIAEKMSWTLNIDIQKKA